MHVRDNKWATVKSDQANRSTVLLSVFLVFFNTHAAALDFWDRTKEAIRPVDYKSSKDLTQDLRKVSGPF